MKEVRHDIRRVLVVDGLTTWFHVEKRGIKWKRWGKRLGWCWCHFDLLPDFVWERGGGLPKKVRHGNRRLLVSYGLTSWFCLDGGKVQQRRWGTTLWGCWGCTDLLAGFVSRERRWGTTLGECWCRTDLQPDFMSRGGDLMKEVRHDIRRVFLFYGLTSWYRVERGV